MFERAYHQMAVQMQGTPGHVHEELLYDAELRQYHVFAEWATREVFPAWVQNPEHADRARPIAPYLKRNYERRLLRVVARTGAEGYTPAS